MALALMHLTTANDDTNATSYTTASLSPTGSSLLVIGIVGAVSGAPPTPTVTGFSATWTAVQSSAFDVAGTQRTLFTFSAQLGASPGTGTIGISFGVTSMSGAGWSVVQITGHNTSAPTRLPVENHSTGTSQSATLAALADTANVALAFVASDEAVTFTAGNTFTMLGQATGAAPVQAIGSLWKLNATNPATTSTGTTGQSWGMVAVEIQVVPAAPVLGFPTVVVSLALGSDPLSASPSWTTIPDNLVRTISFTSSGRSLETDDFEGGSGSIVFDNDDGRFTPGNTASPYYPSIKLRVPVRIVATRGSDVLTIRGFIDATPVKFPNPPNKAICEWPIVDGFTLLNEQAAEYPWHMVIRGDRPKLWVQYDELSGTTALDYSGNGNHGTYTGGPTLQVAFGTGTAATFDGVSQEAVFPGAASITGTGDFAIEFFADFNNSGTDQYVYSQWDFTTSRGVRVACLSTGAIFMETADASGNTSVVTTTTGWAAGAEVHVICRRSGTTHDITVNGTTDGTTTGTARNIPAVTAIAAPGASFGGTIDELATFQGTFTTSNLSRHNQGFLAWHAIGANGQIVYALDAYGWPTNDRNIDTSSTLVLGQFDPQGSVLDIIRLAANSDFGAVYMTLDGKVRFRERQAIMKAPYTTSQATFGNTGSSLPVVIEALELDYDPVRVKNDITLKVNWRTGAIETTPYEVAVRKTDPTSIASYGAKTFSRDVYTMAIGGTSATAIVLEGFAEYVLSRYKDPLREVRELVLHPVEESATALWTQVLTRQQEDRITHTHQLPGGETVSGDYHIQRMRHDIGPGKRWKTTWTISPADVTAYGLYDTGVFDTARFGV